MSSGDNTPEARHFRTLLEDYVTRLNELSAFITLGHIDPRKQQELATAKDEARDRLFAWRAEEMALLRKRCLTHADLPPSYTGNFELIARNLMRSQSSLDREKLEWVVIELARYLDQRK